MKKKILNILKGLSVIFLATLLVCLVCLYSYGKNTVQASSKSDFATHSNYVELDEISPHVIDAIVDIEDTTFWTNPGFNIKSIGRAIFTIAKTKGEKHPGGSGITQQLVKNVFLNQDVKISRKIKEIFIAAQMDNKYSKREILEFYLNNSYFANNCYTIESAAQLYFGKASKELSISESAYLCAILNAPSAFDPLKDIDAAIPRRNLILEKMYEMGDINKKEYTNAINSPVQLKEDFDVKK